MAKLQIKKVDKLANIPTRATSGSAGYDLYALLEHPIIIEPHAIVTIRTGIALGMKDNSHVALIYARSGLSIKHGICLANGVGVIDSDYRGEVLVGLYNMSNKPYTIRNKDRIAQMVLTPIITPELEIVQELDDTSRGSGGFGSSGKE